LKCFNSFITGIFCQFNLYFSSNMIMYFKNVNNSFKNSLILC
jgi:hypothetical protein